MKKACMLSQLQNNFSMHYHNLVREHAVPHIKCKNVCMELVTSAACAKWTEVAGVMCDKKMPIMMKNKIYKTVVKPAMTYGSEC